MHKAIWWFALVLIGGCLFAAACDEDDKECTGQPVPCGGGCTQIGCSTSWSCQGTGACFQYSTQWACDQEMFCSWTAQCFGSPWPCDEFDDKDSCLDQQGCKWK